MRWQHFNKHLTSRCAMKRSCWFAGRLLCFLHTVSPALDPYGVCPAKEAASANTIEKTRKLCGTTSRIILLYKFGFLPSTETGSLRGSWQKQPITRHTTTLEHAAQLTHVVRILVQAHTWKLVPHSPWILNLQRSADNETVFGKRLKSSHQWLWS